MNKKILTFIFVLVCSFFCIGSVNASTKTGINIDAHEHFNYYYEQRQNTGFYQFLKTTDFNDYFNSSSYALYFAYASDLENLIHNQAYQENDSNNIISIPSNAKYAILFRSQPNADGIFSISKNGNDYTFTFNTQDSYDSRGTRILEFFDENGDRISRVQPIGSYGRNLLYWNFSKTYNFSDYDDEDSANFTYLISSFYINSAYSYSYIAPSVPNKIIITDIIEDGEHYLIDDNDNYSGWLRRLFSFGSLDYASVVDTDLAYFKTNVIENSFPSLKQVLDAGVQLQVPEDYTSVSLSSDHENYIFIPKDINNSSLNRKFLTSTSETVGFSNIKVGVNTYNFSDNYSSPYEENALKFISFSQPNKLYILDINKELRKINENYSLTNYYVGFGLFGNSIKYSANIYYNTNAWYICEFDSSNNNSCTFINPTTNEEQTLTHQQMYDILSQHNYSGASVNIFDSAEDQCRTATDYSNLYEYDENCNIIGTADGSNSFFDGLNNITKLINVMKTTFSTIFLYFTIMFEALPVEIRGVLLFSLIAGTILTLYKIIRG